MKMTKTLAIILVIVLALTLIGCAPQAQPAPADQPAQPAPADKPAEPAPAASGEVIKIGLFEPLTGANAGGGTIEAEGAYLANEMKPEVLGKKIELVAADNKSDKVEAATAASRLVEKDKVVAVIGSWGSGLSMAAGETFKNAKVPAMGASCTNPNVTKGNDFYFRVCFLDPFQGTIMANYAFKELGAKKVAIIREITNDYSVGLAQYFEEAFIKLTGDPNSIVARAEYNTNDQDFNAQINNVMKASPDAIFAPGNFTESALIIKQSRQQGYDVPFLGGDTWETPEFIEVGGAEVEGAVFSTFFDSSATLTPETKTFVDAYKAKYGKDPAAVTALAYDAYNVLFAAIEKAGTTDGEKVRQALVEMQKFEGATGYVSFDENGDASKNSAVIKSVTSGAFTYKSTVTTD